MRQDTIGNIKVVYPENVVFLHDNTVISVESTIDNNISAEITIVNPDGESKYISYRSELTKIYFHLDDILKSLYRDKFVSNEFNPWWVAINLYDGSQFSFFAFYIQVVNGTSFTNRTHGASPVIYVYNADELSSLQIYTPSAGQCIWNGGRTDIYEGLNNIDLHIDITTTGEHIFSVQAKSNLAPIAEVIGSQPIDSGSSIIFFDAQIPSSSNTLYGGDIWDKIKIFPMEYRLIYNDVCDNYNFVELRYIDCDGCMRYIGGTLLEEKDSSKLTPFATTTTEIYNTAPKGILTEKSKTLRVGFTDIERISHPQDIQFSDYLWIRGIDGNWHNCILSTTDFNTTRDELMDFELEIITYSL